MFFITQLLGLRKLSDRLGNSCNCFSQLDHNLRAEVFDNVAMNILYIFLVPQKLIKTFSRGNSFDLFTEMSVPCNITILVTV